MNSVTLFGPPTTSRVRDYKIRRTRDMALVKYLIGSWHSTLPNTPAVAQVMFLVYAPNLEPVAAAMWTHPTARNEDQNTTLELSRLAHSPLAPYNLGSYSLARMRKWIRKNRTEIKRLISYQNADVHDGALYKADNWRMVYEKWGESPWQKEGRPGRRNLQVHHKIKWEREP